MESDGCIEQKGVIGSIDNGLAQVIVTSFTACANCYSKNSCGIANSESHTILVPVDENSFSKGDIVTIQMKRSLGMKAAFFAYIFPFILILITLLGLTSLRVKELYSGLISLLILVPYFTGLYLFRNRLKRTFTFTLRKAG
jgi:positive regulator of sigma E activity